MVDVQTVFVLVDYLNVRRSIYGEKDTLSRPGATLARTFARSLSSTT